MLASSTSSTSIPRLSRLASSAPLVRLRERVALRMETSHIVFYTYVSHCMYISYCLKWFIVHEIVCRESTIHAHLCRQPQLCPASEFWHTRSLLHTNAQLCLLLPNRIHLPCWHGFFWIPYRSAASYCSQPHGSTCHDRSSLACRYILV